MQLYLNSNSVMKTFLYVLRNQPKNVKETRNDEGWVDIQPVLKILRVNHPEQKYITAFDIKHMITTDIKKRANISKDLKRVRLEVKM